MKGFASFAAAFLATTVIAVMLAGLITTPTRDLKSDLGRWIKPDALTDEGKAALLRP